MLFNFTSGRGSCKAIHDFRLFHIDGLGVHKACERIVLWFMQCRRKCMLMFYSQSQITVMDIPVFKAIQPDVRYLHIMVL